MDISGWIAHWASWTPGKTALRFEGRSVSYAELEQGVESVAAWLRAAGVLPGDRVAYLGPNCPELLEFLFACSRLGGIFVPLNNRMPSAELCVFVEATRPRLLVAEHGFRGVAIDSVGDLGPHRVKTFAVGGEFAGRATQRVPAFSGIDLVAPVLILFTSGTTGHPKGATFTHQNITFNALNVITAVGLTTADEILTAVPMFHTGGLFIHTLPGLCAGAANTIHRQFDPGQLLEEIPRQRITLLACVPAMTFALATHPAWYSADLSSLRSVYTGSTVVTPRAIEPWQAKGVRIGQGYGSTEACPTATMMPPGSSDEAAFTAGKPTLYTQMRVVDEAGSDLPAGQPGEVWFRGPAVMQGYWENEQATREAFCDGWFRNGDLGLLDDDGYVHVVGRIKDIIIVGSSNVYPSDLEAVLNDCPEIREAAVVGRPDDELGEVPVACVVPTQGPTFTSQQVIGLFENRLATYKHPRDVIFLEALPRNWHGKIDRLRLRELVAEAQAQGFRRG
ncbi:AMP-binding protein [Candidatus Nephthysia bennettiae]|uniref:AMP-binding protein n=1 Tax=Candidatus Nephthysia bennettiae TaxID=3127016 RepID=A0A934K768_9BACT|nr:AMP-binding protein [Candidatus Dormibacteraeota bacterium]